MLVSTLDAFEAYQLKDAWTWEHQALVRARVISGSSKLSGLFEEVRKKVISQQRDSKVLLVDVSEMREKMRTHLGSSESQQAQQFNLKQDRGGIVDIEFIVQYFCLAYGAQYPQIFTYTDNIRILDAIEDAGLINSEDTNLLREAYKAFRAIGHRQAMQEQSTNIEAHKLLEYRHKVSQLWAKFIIEPQK
jgi:glutamate-ammonia-ligase adenylyltransferase